MATDPAHRLIRHLGADLSGPIYTHTTSNPPTGPLTVHAWTLDVDAATGDTIATFDVAGQPDDVRHALEQLAGDGIRVSAYTRRDPDGSIHHVDRTSVLWNEDDLDAGHIPCPTCGRYRARFIRGGRTLTDGPPDTEPCAACTTWREAGS